MTSSLRPVVVSSSLRAALALLPFFLAACGGGGSAGGGPAPPGPPVLTAPDLTDQAAQTFTAGVALPAAVVFVNAAGGALLADDAVPAAGCLASAELPEGLAVLRTTDTDSCRIIGTPAVGSVGVYLVTVTAVNSAGTDVTPAAVTITVAPATPVVSVPFNSLGTRQAGVSVSSVVGGTVHALLLPTGMAAPAAEAFAAGAGVMSLVVAAGASADFTFTGLAPATAYTAHAVLSTADSVSSAVGDDSFMTMALPEVLTASITRVAGRELDISVTAAPAGTLYLLVRADTDAGLAPDSATALMTAVVDGGAGAYSEELAFDDNVAGDIVLTADGLSPGVPYTVYLATANSAGDLSALVTRMAQTYAPQFAAPSARTIYLIKDVLYDNTVDAANNAMPDTPGQFIDPRYVDDNDIRGTIVECTLVAVDGQAVDTNDPLRQLPAGVSLAVLATGIGCAFTGTPTTFTPMREYTLTATDDSNAVSDSYSVRVKVIDALAPNIQSILGGPVILEQNRTYAEATVEMPEATPAVRFVNRGGPPNAATDVPAGCTALNLPAGLMVERTGDGNSCQIIGTPLAVTNGAVAISIWVRNSNGADLRLAAVSIVVRPAVVIVPLPNLDDADAVTRTALELIAPIVFTNNGGGFLLA
ncbi:MAG: putative Ig domain-containing protein, partial [Proteobacteria bacterium]|nr:putative Ig domain-containing protein [Pseudomonadota bacterium]